MTKKIKFVLLFIFVSFYGIAQNVQKGPYTIELLTDNVFHIEDSNDSNPAGYNIDEDGNRISTNNCSDMYLIVGTEKALLIDLSNAIDWDDTATESLRSLVFERTEGKDFYITVTHRHGDHLGMLPAFVDDPNVTFWLSEAEVSGMSNFPQERTTYFKENESLNLGEDYDINTMEVPGHTDHSTLFFLKDKDLVFSGDAIGSGNGVWLFNEESFYTYKKSINNLINYIEDPVNGIDLEKLEIHGGHAWQKGEMEKLTSQYIYDMKVLIEKMEQEDVETEEMSSFISFLNTNFKYGTATITWNKGAAEKYANEMQTE